MKGKISIIVPIYNAEAFLEKCLNSLRVQTFENLEILLIDDGSTDSSASICKKYAAEDNRFQYIFQKNSGVSSARNHGLDLASGDYIGFCDSDDWAEPDMFETLYSLSQETQADISIVSFIREGGPQDYKQVKNNDLAIHSFDSAGAIIEMLRAGMFGGHLCTKLVRKALFDHVRFNEAITIFEDSLASWDLFFKAKKIVFQNVVKYHYRYNPSSAMRSAFKESEWSGRDATYIILDRMKAFLPDDLVYAQRTIIASSYRLAEKMALAGKLTDENYQILHHDFNEHYHKEVAGLFEKRMQLKLSIFRMGRMFFLLYMKVVKVRRSFEKIHSGG